MISPGRFDIKVNRWQPAKLEFLFQGFDFTGATVQFQVRTYRDQAGTPFISLTSAPVGALTITVRNNEDGVRTSTVTLSLDEATIEALPLSRPVGCDVPLAYDLVITDAQLGKVRWLEGAFIVHAGVTQL